MLTKLFIALVAAGVFLRIVGKEKNRRERHLLLRLEEYRKAMEAKAAEEAARQQEENPAETPVAEAVVGAEAA